MLAFSLNGYAQSKGVLNNSSSYTQSTMHTVTPQGVVKGTGVDTLVNGDTGYVYIWAGQAYDQAFHLITTTVSGTVATTSNILYGYNNGGNKLTAAQIPTVVATAITGNTTYCAGCVGASSTTVPGASKEYIWQIPKSCGALFDNYFIRTIQTGTATATYTGTIVTQN